MKLYNTLTKTEEIFIPNKDKKVNMFACGPTVYDFAHIGNGRTAITMDVLSRLLRFLDFEVFYLVNITDIDDKIINRASKQKISWESLRDKYEAQYKKDMDKLDVKIDEYARATDYIDDIKRQVSQLVDKGHAYKINDGIYFEISTFKDYGKLSGRNDLEKDDAVSRIDQNEEKRGWNDFCLWKFSKTNEPCWPADFGDGRPGWHIEDTAITEHFFGPQYDIHGGGMDLIFPHHEAELTQMESASGKVPFVKYWVHGGLLYINNERMGKSNKNFYTIQEILEKYTASVIRLFMLQGHYRSTLAFSFELLDSTNNRFKRWQRVADLRWQPNTSKNLTDKQIDSLRETYNNFISCLENDLDTPGAIAQIEKFMEVVEANGCGSQVYIHFDKLLSSINDIFGVNIFTKDISLKQKQHIKTRDLARTENNWQKSDKMRNELLSQNITLNDTELGAIWSRL